MFFQWFVGSIAILPWSTQGALRVQRRQHRAAHRQLPEDGRGRLNGAASAKNFPRKTEDGEIFDDFCEDFLLVFHV